MKYALERLDKLITYSLEPTLFEEATFPDDQLQKLITTAGIEKEKIRLYLQRMAIQAAKRKSLQLQFKGFEVSIKRLQTRVNGYKTNARINALEQVYATLDALLDELLQHINSQYYPYLVKKPPDVSKTTQQEDGTERGLLLDMTVEEISLLHKVMKQTGLLLNNNITKLMQDLSRIVHTKKKYDVSAASLYNSYYMVVPDTVKSLNDRLIAMLNTLRKIAKEPR